MNYIYCYTNKINQHKYVGQTNNFNRRVNEHRSCAFNKSASSYNHLIHKKIREYGEEKFQISIIETLYGDDIEEVNKRERYWVQKMNSYCGNGAGYNLDLGGGRREYSSVLTQDELKEVKEKIKNNTPFVDIQIQYSISASFISSINHGTYFYDDQEKYPLCRYYKTDEDYDELIDLLTNSTYTLVQISEMLNMGYSTVKKINMGTLRHGLYYTYPIRTKTANEQRADKIKNLLMTTDYSNIKIAEIINSSKETVRRINVGSSFKNESLSYPLRKPVTTIPG